MIVRSLLAGLVVAGAVAAAAGTPAQAATPSVPQVMLGAYTSTPATFTALQEQLDRPLAIASSFRGWGDIFPDATQRAVARTGHTLLVAWDLGATAATRFSTFYNHQHDAYLAEEAAAARAYGKPLYIRPWAEMNGDWSPFQPTANGNHPAGGTYAQFVSAWRYLVQFFRTHGATNVRWVFNPTADTYSQTTDVRRIWPGSAYVDVLGLDGYNWGNGAGLVWRSFGNIFATQLQRLQLLAPYLPVWICEFGSKEPSLDDGARIDDAVTKAGWYLAMMRWVAARPSIKALVMFNVRKERDWSIQSSRGALAVMRLIAAHEQRSMT